MITAATFYFAPTAENAWELSVDRFSDEAAARWPASAITREILPRGLQYIDFWNDDPRYDAMYKADENLILQRITPREASGFVCWFIGLLPVDASIRFSSEAAVESGDGTSDWWLPLDADAGQVTQILESHLREVLGPDIP